MRRYDLADFDWRVIDPLLPNRPRGVPRVNDRRVLNGIWVVRSDASWCDLPERYGPRITCGNAANRWQAQDLMPAGSPNPDDCADGEMHGNASESHQSKRLWR